MCVLLAVASSICEWLMHEPLVPVYIFSGLVWNTKFQKHWSHSQDPLIDDMRSRCTNFMYGLNIFFCFVFCVCTLCSLHVCTAAKSNALWAERNRMGGFVKAGAHMLVNLQAGNCTGIDTQTHTLPTIYTQFVTQAPMAAEAILPSCTSLDLALLRTLSSVL